MNLFVRIIRKLLRTSWVLFFRSISTAKPEGEFRSIAPVLCEGKGRIVVGEGTSFGFIEDADYWTSYEFLNVRNKDSQIVIGKNCQICNHFTAVSEGGHSSAPKPHSPIARLADFVHDVETHNLFRRKMPKEVAAMFEALAPYAGFPLKLVFSNLWLFRPLLLKVLPMISAQAGAMIRTTIAFTMMSGSDACNVMPQEASVCANMRFIPHQGMEESLAVIRKLAEKHGLETAVLAGNDYTKPTDIRGEAFRTVQRVIGETFPGCAGSPYVMTGATDARFYEKICENVVRFAPVIYGPEQMKGMHGLNENIRYDCLPGAVDFYRNLIRAPRGGEA